MLASYLCIWVTFRPYRYAYLYNCVGVGCVCKLTWISER